MNNKFYVKEKIIYYIVFFIFFIILINGIIVKNNNLFKLIGIKNYTILSGSMKPKINPGDLALVKYKNPNKLSVGNIITFKQGDDYITHRIISITETSFITKGDNNNIEDNQRVGFDEVIGKVVITIPKLGYFMGFLESNLFLSFFLFIIALSIIFDIFKFKIDYII